jgi:MFS family permease
VLFKLNEHLAIQPSIAAVSLVSLVVMMGSSMITPSLTLYAKQDLGANEFLVGVVIAGFAIGRLVFDIPAGFVADRLGLSRTMILGLAILFGSSLLAGFASSYWVLLCARVLEGVGSSIYVSAAIAFVLLSFFRCSKARKKYRKLPVNTDAWTYYWACNWSTNRSLFRI